MRLIIAGSRTITDINVVLLALVDSGFEPTSIVSGKAPGVDTLGEEIAKMLGIPVDPYPITDKDWQIYGNGAGPIRNTEMAKNADAVLVIWDGKSTGTKDMIAKARKFGLKSYVHMVEEEKPTETVRIDL